MNLINNLIIENKFKNELEKTLIKLGISNEQILKSKSEYNENALELFYYYDHKETLYKEQIINVDDIKGINREKKRLSWFCNLYHSFKNTRINNERCENYVNLVDGKFYKLLQLFNEGSLDYVMNIFSEHLFFKQNIDKVYFHAFINGNSTKYFLHNDGTHRTILAKVLGVKKIKTRILSSYEFNEEKYKLFLNYKELTKEFSLSSKEFDQYIKDTETFEKLYKYKIKINSLINCLGCQYEHAIVKEDIIICDYPFSGIHNYKNNHQRFEECEKTIRLLNKILTLTTKYSKVYNFSPKLILRIVIYLHRYSKH